MSYFSRLAVKRAENESDWSWPSEERLLLDRIEDLELQKEIILEGCVLGRESWGLRDEDLRYVLPSDLYDLSDVNRALFLAESDLWKLLGISWGLYADEVKPEPKEEKPFVIPGQMTIDEFLKGKVA